MMASEIRFPSRIPWVQIQSPAQSFLKEAPLCCGLLVLLAFIIWNRLTRNFVYSLHAILRISYWES